MTECKTKGETTYIKNKKNKNKGKICNRVDCRTRPKRIALPATQSHFAEAVIKGCT